MTRGPFVRYFPAVNGRTTDLAGERRVHWSTWLLVLVPCALVYLRALGGELVYDDRLLIGRNPRIADLAQLPQLFTSGYWDFLQIAETENIGYWRPLTALVQALVWPLAGTAPGPYHAASLLIHLGAVVAACSLARRLGASPWVATATGLLFGLHPAHVESVAWISALNDPLFGCLALGALERFLAWREHGSRGWPLGALVLFSLALLAKELAAALVPLLVLLDLLRPVGAGEPSTTVAELPATPPSLRRLTVGLRAPWRTREAYLPFALAFALYLVARMLVFASPWAGFDRITTDFGVSARRLLELRVELFGGALELLAIPWRLVLFRPFRPELPPFDPTLVRAAVWSCVFVGLFVGLWLGRRRLALAGLCVIPAGLLPALIKVESLGQFPLSDRFLYLPAFGAALGVALLLRHWLPGRAAHLGLALLAGLYATRTWTRSADWHDEVGLFRVSARAEPRSVYVLWGLGRALLERYNAQSDPRDLDEAWRTFEAAQELLLEAKTPAGGDLWVTQRDFVQVTLGFAWCSIYRDEASGAILALEDLIRRIEEIHAQEDAARAAGLAVRPSFLDLEKAYTALGAAELQARQFPDAERSFLKAIELQPATPEAHQNLGRLYVAERRFAEAAQSFERALALRPGNAEDRLLLAQALESGGEHARARELAQRLTSELPTRAEPWLVLATAALNEQDGPGAVAALDRALERAPRNALVWYQKARAALLLQDPRAALLAFRNAVEIDPNNFEAHYDLASLLLAQGAHAEARPYVVRAYTLAPELHRARLRAVLDQLELTDPGELVQLAQCDQGRGEFASALAFTERLLTRAPQHVEGLLLRARLRRRVDEHEGALADYRSAAQQAAQDYSIWSELGGYLVELEHFSEARTALERARELGPPANWPGDLRKSSLERVDELLERCQSRSDPIGPKRGD